MKKNIIFITVGLIMVFLVYVASELMIPLPLGSRSIEFQIKKGSTFRQAVESLSQKGLVRDKWVFILLGRITGIAHRIKAGYYPVRGTMSPWDIFKAIKSGKIIEFEITIVPGDSLVEIADKFTAAGIIDTSEFYRLCSDRDLLDILDVDAPSLEGYLYPDTYRFPKGLEIKEVLSLMVGRLREIYDADMLAHTFEMGLAERDVLTMASIIEKEAVVDEERPIIAGVYYNRLKRKIPLQADPTTTYGIKSFKEKITKEDLMRKTRYNTYVINGLPPGPIASPGQKSIIAALYPAKVSYLYFVSNNDGTHNFSVSLDAHNVAVRAYRDKKKNAASKGAF